MHFLKNSLILLSLLMAMIFITSCNKDEIQTITPQEPVVTVDTLVNNPLLTRSSTSEEGLDLGCFTVLYPFSVVTLDSTIINITSDDDFNGNEENFIDFVYPITLDADGVQSTINSLDELFEAFANCVPSGGWSDDFFPAYDINYENSCYTLQYPLTLENVDGQILTVNTADELNDAIAADLYSFTYPLSLINEDGELVVVDSVDGLFNALIACNDFGWDNDSTGYWDWENSFEYFGCYVLNFPFNVVTANGEIVEVNDHMEYCDLLLQGDIISFSYPLTLTDLEGNVIIANSDEELNDLMADCGFPGDDCPGLEAFSFLEYYVSIGCIAIDYPLGATTINGDSVLITSNEQLTEAVFNFEVCEISFPISFTDQDGNSYSANSMNELFEATLDCGFGEVPVVLLLAIGVEECYSISYPMSFTVVEGGEVITVNNNEEFFAQAFSSQSLPCCLVYPITVVLNNGDAVVLESDNDVIDLSEDCE